MSLSNAVPKCPTGRTMREDAAMKRAAKAKALDDCNDAVDARDHMVCRVSGIKLAPFSSEPRKKLNRHHMLTRGAHPAERHNPANVITISQWVSDQIHIKGVMHLEGDANLRDADGRFCGVTLRRLDEQRGWLEVRTL